MKHTHKEEAEVFKHLRKEVPKKTNVWSEIWNRKSGMKKTKGEKKESKVINGLL